MAKRQQVTFRSTICIYLSIVIIVMTSGCSNIKKMANSILDNTKQPTNLEISQNVLNCFDNNSVQELKALFCARTQGIEDIDEQIQNGFEFFNGKVTSFDENVLGSEGESVDHGTVKELSRTLHIENIKTDSGKTYQLYVSINLIYKNDKKREGITDITITNTDDDRRFEIGYSWPDHYTEGRKLSIDIVNALGDGDADELKDVMCEKVLEQSDIDEQINSAFEFFDGKALMGKVEGSKLNYDGKHDFKTKVSDDEIIDGHEPVRTSIYAYCDNIETNADRIYELEFYAELFNDDEEEYEGVSQITIFDENGNKVVIGGKIS